MPVTTIDAGRLGKMVVDTDRDMIEIDGILFSFEFFETYTKAEATRDITSLFRVRRVGNECTIEKFKIEDAWRQIIEKGRRLSI